MRHICIDDKVKVIDFTKTKEEIEMVHIKTKELTKKEILENSKLGKFARGVAATIKDEENWTFQMKGAAVTGVIVGTVDYIQNKDIKHAFDAAANVAAKGTLLGVTVQSVLNGAASTFSDGYAEYLEGE